MKLKPLNTSASTHVLVLVLGLTAGLSYTQNALAADSKPNTESEEIVVTGMRQALEKSLEVKKTSTNIVETLDMSDINATPDVTIADAIVRLPGINGARDRGNQSQASIRGLGPRMVFGTLNGREVTSSEPGRSIRYEQYPSELINSVKVYKSQSADLISGGIAGTLDLETVSPLSYKGPTYSARAGLVEYDGSEGIPNYDPLGNRYSGAIIKQVNDQFGFAIGVASQLQKNAYPSYQAWGFNTGGGQPNLPAGGGDLTGTGVKGYVPWGMQTEVKKIETQRDGGMAVLEFKPTDSLHIKYDALYTKFDISEQQNQTWYQNIGNWDGGENGGYSNVTVENNYAVAATANTWTGDIRHVIAAYTQTNSVFAQGVNLEYTGAENWEIKADLSTSDAKRDNYWNAIYLDQFGHSFSYDLRGVPSISVAVGSAAAKPETAQLGLDDWNEGSTLDDKSTAFNLDFKRSIDKGDFTSLDFGARIADRDKEVIWTGYTISDKVGAKWDWGKMNYVSAPSGLFSSYTVGAIKTSPFLNASSYDAAASALFGGTDFSQYAARNNSSSWKVSEKNSEAYVKGNWAGQMGEHEYNANIGARFVSLETESFGYPTGSVTNKNTYVLPSASLNYYLSDDKILRTGIAKAISRPPLDELRAGQYISATNTASGGNAGNPKLDPFTSDQVDLSYEWYFAKESLFAAAVYYKRISNYVGYTSFDIPSTSGQPTTIWAPKNSNKTGNINGVELTFQMPIAAGFGIYSNYAYANSNIKEFAPTGNPYSMVGLAKQTATLDLWYSANGFDARLGWKYHSPYTTGFEWDSSQLRKLDAETTLGLSTSYQFTDNWSVRFEANNLTNQPLRLSQNNVDADLRRYDVYGRTFMIDITWKK